MLTPQESYPKLAKALNVPNVILKREDLHKYGSHKGRSIPKMITSYANQGYNNFVISSSGNAALAAIHLVRDYNFDNPNHKITLKVFVGKNIDKEKLKILEHSILSPYEGEVEGVGGPISIIQTDRPKQSAFQTEKETKTRNLRQSTDDSALKGYKTLAEELNIIKNLQAIFIPTSSGATAEALGKFLPPTVQIHIVQTSACHPMAQEFNANFITEKKSIATAIVDIIAHRKEKVLQTIKNSHGSGWVISNDEIKKAIKLVREKTDIEISPNSALSVAGLTKAVKNSWKFDSSVVCLITGK